MNRKKTDMSLERTNYYLRENIIVLIRFWGKIYKYDKKLYEELADGLEVVPTMLLHTRAHFKTTKSAAWHCYNKIAKELRLMPRNDVDRPGHEAAKDIFEKRLRG